ncbi:hypothetical protein ACOMHN_006717 [Nucella lapillus]
MPEQGGHASTNGQASASTNGQASEDQSAIGQARSAPQEESITDQFSDIEQSGVMSPTISSLAPSTTITQTSTTVTQTSTPTGRVPANTPRPGQGSADPHPLPFDRLMPTRPKTGRGRGRGRAMPEQGHQASTNGQASEGQSAIGQASASNIGQASAMRQASEDLVELPAFRRARRPNMPLYTPPQRISVAPPPTHWRRSAAPPSAPQRGAAPPPAPRRDAAPPPASQRGAAPPPAPQRGAAPPPAPKRDAAPPPALRRGAAPPPAPRRSAAQPQPAPRRSLAQPQPAPQKSAAPPPPPTLHTGFPLRLHVRPSEVMSTIYNREENYEGWIRTPVPNWADAMEDLDNGIITLLL